MPTLKQAQEELGLNEEGVFEVWTYTGYFTRDGDRIEDQPHVTLVRKIGTFEQRADARECCRDAIDESRGGGGPPTVLACVIERGRFVYTPEA